MNSKNTCRIIGWVFVFLGLIGFTTTHLGTYLQFSRGESLLYLCLGILSVFAARRRRRVAALTALFSGLFYLLWGINGVVQILPPGPVEPLDTLLQILAAMWGLGTATYDALLWRKILSSV